MNKTACVFIIATLISVGIWGVINEERSKATLENNQEIEQDTLIEFSFDDLLDAIEWVESKGNANAVGDIGKAIGAYQIHKIYVDDVNRIIALWGLDKQFTYNDRWDKNKSRSMTEIYTLYWCKYHLVDIWQLGMSNNEANTRIHNTGPDGWRNEPQWFVRNRGYTLEQAEKKIRNAKAYWLKVKERLYD